MRVVPEQVASDLDIHA